MRTSWPMVLACGIALGLRVVSAQQPARSADSVSQPMNPVGAATIGTFAGFGGILAGMLVGQPGGDAGEVTGVILLEPLIVASTVHSLNDHRGSMRQTTAASYGAMVGIIGISIATNRHGKDVFTDNPGAILTALAAQSIIATVVEWRSARRTSSAR